ncbi:MAG TPA: hypothetical protein VFR70_00840 [Flavobacterium sp.]|nr:hypothetical protein [Flavobacterium sp.]
MSIAAKPNDPASPDAILVPRMTRAVLASKNGAYANSGTGELNQNGALVFITALDGAAIGKTVNVTATGFYYYDGVNAVWVAVAPNTTASNGLTKAGNDIKLGGTLTAATSIAQAGFDLTTTGAGNVGIGLASPGLKFKVLDNTSFTSAEIERAVAEFSIATPGGNNGLSISYGNFNFGTPKTTGVGVLLNYNNPGLRSGGYLSFLNGNLGLNTTVMNSNVSMGGSVSMATRKIDAGGSITDSDYICIFINQTAASFTLPPAASASGRIYVLVYSPNSGTPNTTINAQAFESIKFYQNTVSTFNLSPTQRSVTVQSTGISQWTVINSTQ